MPTRTFSSAVMFWKRRMFWNVRPMPRCVNACGGLPVMSSPLNCTRPAVGLYTPVSMLKNVVLPAPFGPMSETIEPLGNDEVDVVDRDEPAELLAEHLRLE